MDHPLPTTVEAPFSSAEAKVVLLEGISDTAAGLLAAGGYAQIERHPKALEGQALRDAIAGAHILGIRSRTQLTAEMIDAAGPLMAIGCFCIGTDQVDLRAARARGIPVFNAPFSNTRSVAELTIGEIVMLLRRILPRSAQAHAGGWDKSATGSFEVRGKTLGIVGYGNIGSQLSTLAEAMGMHVRYYDRTDKLRHGNTQPVATLEELLAISDVVTLHVPDTPATKGMIGGRRDRRHEARRLPHQQRPRRRPRSRRRRVRAALRPSRRRRDRRLPGRAQLRRRNPSPPRCRASRT